jgi:hypothetical protein
MPPGCPELVLKSFQHNVAWACQRPEHGPQTHAPPRGRTSSFMKRALATIVPHESTMF